MLIKYKNKMITLRELCIELKINYGNFMAWCHEHALQIDDLVADKRCAWA